MGEGAVADRQDAMLHTGAVNPRKVRSGIEVNGHGARERRAVVGPVGERDGRRMVGTARGRGHRRTKAPRNGQLPAHHMA